MPVMRSGTSRATFVHGLARPTTAWRWPDAASSDERIWTRASGNQPEQLLDLPAMPSVLALTVLGLSGRELAIVATVLIIIVASIGRFVWSRRKK